MAAPIPTPPLLHTSAADTFDALAAEARRRKRNSRRTTRATLVLAFLVGIGLIWNARHPHAAGAPPVTASTLAGTWELVTLGKHGIGEASQTALISQRVTFRDGRITGETRLRAETQAASVRLPFPDRSVRKIDAPALSREVSVTWSGAYEVNDSGRVALTVGKAKYSANATYAAKVGALSFEHDPVLTYSGRAVYRRVEAGE